MVKIDAAQKRIFTNVFICRKCNSKIRAQPKKIAEGKVRCRKCKGNVFRTKKRKTSK
ncbi:MAG: hypothetical protein QXP53_01610 [Candidatus Pacearchaeota archaeon]